MTTRIFQKLIRQKTETDASIKETKLARVLTTIDLTLLGIGSTLGVGIYVLAGTVARDVAGPAVAISFLIAAIASAFAGVCYAEFGARVPKAGSAYVYSYHTVGEFIAFLIGWNLILEYVIGAASVTKGLSTYIDALLDHKIANALTDAMPINVDFLGKYPDFFAFAAVCLFAICLAFGMKESSLANNICTAINMGVVVFVVIAGAMNADVDNWALAASSVPDGYGVGGFAPYGINGIIKGAATCFYGFIGFDCVATTGEEAKTPQRSIPIAIVGSLSVVFAAYFSVATVLTLMWPYYAQDPNAPLTYVFDQIGWTGAKWVVSIGAIFGLLPSLLGSLYPLPRIIYAMASDGLLFKPLGVVSERFKSPVTGTLIAGFLTGIMALLFDLNQLVDMMSIGTLLAYTIVAACVLILRFRKSDEDEQEEPRATGGLTRRIVRQLTNRDRLRTPSTFSSYLVTTLVGIYCLFGLATMACVAFLGDELSKVTGWAVFLIVLFAFVTFLSLCAIWFQPSSEKKLFFKVPLVPLIPGLSILANLYLMLMLDVWTWIRFGVWMIVGVVIYFTYGIQHSHENVTEKTVKRKDSLGVNNVAFAQSDIDIRF